MGEGLLLLVGDGGVHAAQDALKLADNLLDLVGGGSLRVAHGGGLDKERTGKLGGEVLDHRADDVEVLGLLRLPESGVLDLTVLDTSAHDGRARGLAEVLDADVAVLVHHGVELGGREHEVVQRLLALVEGAEVAKVQFDRAVAVVIAAGKLEGGAEEVADLFLAVKGRQHLAVALVRDDPLLRLGVPIDECVEVLHPLVDRLVAQVLGLELGFLQRLFAELEGVDALPDAVVEDVAGAVTLGDVLVPGVDEQAVVGREPLQRVPCDDQVREALSLLASEPVDLAVAAPLVLAHALFKGVAKHELVEEQEVLEGVDLGGIDGGVVSDRGIDLKLRPRVVERVEGEHQLADRGGRALGPHGRVAFWERVVGGAAFRGQDVGQRQGGGDAGAFKRLLPRGVVVREAATERPLAAPTGGRHWNGRHRVPYSGRFWPGLSMGTTRASAPTRRLASTR